MGSEPVVVDLSSDEEDDGNGGQNRRLDTWNDVSACWEPDFFDRGTGERVKCEDYRSTGSSKLKDGNLGYESDDDCLVLDYDPEQPKPVYNAKVGGGDDEDDLLVVQEKGQVACRDYPHPRHLCATFLFSASPHEQHCYLCHCYVCDCPAPCKFWGNGDLITDHCHSTDKDSKWNILRQNLKRKAMSSHSDKHLDKTLYNATQNQVPMPHANQFRPTTPSPISYPIRPCSATVNNLNSHSQSQASAVADKPRNVLYSARSSPSNNGTVPFHGAAQFSGAMAPQPMQPHFKRPRTTQSGFRPNTSGLKSTLPRNYNFPRPVHCKGYGTANRLQWCQNYQPVVSGSAAAIAGMNNGGVEPLPAPVLVYQNQPGSSSVNNSKSWQPAPARTGCNLGVSDYMSGNTYTEELIATAPSIQNFVHPQVNASNSDFTAQSATLNDIDPLGAVSNKIGGSAEHGDGKQPERPVMQPYNPLPSPLTSSDSQTTYLKNILASVEKMLEEPVNDIPLAGLDPNSLPDLSIPWSSLFQIQNNSNRS